MGVLKVKVFAVFIIITEVHSAILESPVDNAFAGKAINVGEKKTEHGDIQVLQNRHQRFFSSVKLNSIDSANELDSSHVALEKVDEDPNTALSGVYTDCLLNLSFPCLQRKILVFIDRLGRMAKFNLIGNFLSVVRTAKESRPSVREGDLVARKIDDEKTLRGMIDASIDDFFEDHVIRVTVPTMTGDVGRATSVLDFRIGDDFGLEESRMKKKKVGGKMKGMKKMMMMGCMMMMGKVAMFGPIIMGISSLAAVKALILSTMALTITKIIILKKLKMMLGKGGMSGWPSSGGGGGGWPSSGGGGGGGWPSSGGGGGGGGGWSSGGGGDRSLDSHSLVYQGYR